jgi:golgi-specific brefeldin A-resistance guanine nucleotide exchange factor 1
MDSAKVFVNADGYSQLWTITWDKINTFLPHLREDLFKSHPSVEGHQKVAADAVATPPMRQSPLPGEVSPPPSSPPPQK